MFGIIIITTPQEAVRPVRDTGASPPHARTHVRTHERTHAHTRKRTRTRAHTCIGVYTDICTDSRAHAPARTRKRAHIRAHKRTQMWKCFHGGNIITAVEILSPRWEYYHRGGNTFSLIHDFSLDSLRCEKQASVQVEIAIMTLDFTWNS